MSTNYRSLIQQFGKQHILVIGELILDVNLAGTSNRICREAPVPIVNVQAREDMPGGAANVAVNLAAMGAKATLLSITGKDQGGQIVVDLLRHKGVNTQAIIFDHARETLTKKRVLSDGYLLVRYDTGTTDGLSSAAEQQLIRKLNILYHRADAVLISDYGYGLLSDNVIAALKCLQEREPKLLVIDSKHLERYYDLHPTAVKPNYGEAIQLLGLQKEDKDKRGEQILG